jgi:hypothetical protein
LFDLASIYISEISKRKYIFNRRELVAEELKDIKLNDIKTLYNSILNTKKTILIL